MNRKIFEYSNSKYNIVRYTRDWWVNCNINFQYTGIMSELLYEESVFDDSSDLEESWAGENVTFDTSPTSRK